jgi:hypothetical protein
MPKEIPLTLGKVAVVDAADYEWLSQWKWYARPASHGAAYAAGISTAFSLFPLNPQSFHSCTENER